MTKVFEYRMQPRFRDTDLLGHINNAVYLSYVESCRVAWLRELSLSSDVRTLPIILARSEVDYLAQAFHTEMLVIRAQLDKIGTKSFCQGYEIEAEGRGLVARAKAVLVWFDFKQNCSVPIPEEARQAMRPYCCRDQET